MKKIFLLIVILFQVEFLSAQERDNVGHRVGAWTIGTPQQGIAWKIRRSYYSDNSEKFTNEIEIKNTNNSTVTFSYNISENANETSTRHRITLAQNGTYTSTFCPNAEFVYFYVELSNGQSTNTTTQQNDPTFDRNNASFQDYYKRATSAGQAGNYDEAISLWKSAIAVAVNDDQRNNARAWLEEVQKAKNISSNSQNKQQNTFTPPQPTKLQKQAEALGQLNELFGTFTNEKQKEIDRQKRMKEYERQKKEKELEKVRIQERENLERTKIENEAKVPISNIELINLINNNQKKEITKYFINQGFVFKYDDVDQIMFEGFSLNYSFLNFNKKKILVSINTEKSSEIIHILQKLSSLKEHISFFSKDSDKLLESFYITIEKDNKTLSDGLEDDYSYILKKAEKLYKQNSNVQNKEKTELVKEKVVENSNLNNSQSTINDHSFGKELTKNFGKIENGKTFIHSFRLSKKIKSANASCGCITVETNQNVPTVVMATFHGIANDYKGPFLKSIAVIYEDGTTETLYLKGELQ